MDKGIAMEQELRRLREENEYLRQECLRARRQELMEHLLRDEFNGPEQIASDLREVGITLEKESFVELYVNVLMMPPAPIKTPDNTYRPAKDFRAIFEDGLGNLIRKAYPESFCAATRWGTGVAAILQMTPVFEVPPDGTFINHLNQQALWLIDTLNDLHGMEVFIAISRPHQGIEGIPKAHQEIERITGYRAVMGIDVPLLCYHDFEMAEKDKLNDFNTLQLERAYLGSVELGEFSKACDILQSLIDLEFRRAVPALETLHAKLSAKLELLLIALEKFKTEEDPSIYGEVLTMQRSLAQNDLTVEEMRQKIGLIFEQIIRFMDQQQAPKWMSMLLDYVDQNYTYSELNVASISEAFGLNPSYLSREVKRCTGSGLLDLLQQKRLERATALLGGGLNMTEAARQSGFGDVRALRRAMKRYQTGEAPVGRE